MVEDKFLPSSVPVGGHGGSKVPNTLYLDGRLVQIGSIDRHVVLLELGAGLTIQSVAGYKVAGEVVTHTVVGIEISKIGVVGFCKGQSVLGTI